MRNYNQLEVILFSGYSFRNQTQKELVKWLATIAQAAMDYQQQKAKKIFLKTLKDSPAIHMS